LQAITPLDHSNRKAFERFGRSIPGITLLAVPQLRRFDAVVALKLGQEAL
jgi:hypothetical protein